MGKRRGHVDTAIVLLIACSLWRSRGVNTPTDANSESESDVLRHRGSEAFKNFYLTLVSLLQGAVIALGSQSFGDARSALDAYGWLRYGFSAVAAILVWHHYVMGFSLFSWLPTLADTALPVALAVAQLMVIDAAEGGGDVWVYGLSGFAFFGALALMEMFGSARRLDQNAFALGQAGRWPVRLTVWLITMSVALSGWAATPWQSALVEILVSYGVAVVFLAFSLFYWRSVLSSIAEWRVVV